MFSNSFPRTSCTLQENTRVATALGLPQYLDWWTFRPLTVLNFLSHLSQVRLASSCSNFDLSTTFFDKPALQNLVWCTLRPVTVLNCRWQFWHLKDSWSATTDRLSFSSDSESATADCCCEATNAGLATAKLFNLSFRPSCVSNQPAFFFVLATLIFRPAASARVLIRCRFSCTSLSETPTRATSATNSQNVSCTPRISNLYCARSIFKASKDPAWVSVLTFKVAILSWLLGRFLAPLTRDSGPWLNVLIALVFEGWDTTSCATN